MRSVTFIFFIALVFVSIELKSQTSDSTQQYIFFSWSDTCPPYHVEISNYIPDDEKQTYVWKIGDTVKTETSPEFTISDTGVYVVYYSAYKGDKYLYSDSIDLNLFCDTIYLEAGPFYYGCGHPDFRIIASPDCTIHEVLVFDRWGRAVFQTTDPLASWDFKTLDGLVLNQDTYVTYIYFSDQFGNLRIQRSQFELIR